MYDGSTQIVATPPHEYSALEHILLGDLREMLEDFDDTENRKWMLAVLDTLLDTLACQFALEEHDGYMSEVLDEFPSWQEQVDSILLQHNRLYDDLWELRGELVRDGCTVVSRERVRLGLTQWMDQLNQHQEAEVRLIQTAFNLDPGSGE